MKSNNMARGSLNSIWAPFVMGNSLAVDAPSLMLTIHLSKVFFFKGVII